MSIVSLKIVRILKRIKNIYIHKHTYKYTHFFFTQSLHVCLGVKMVSAFINSIHFSITTEKMSYVTLNILSQNAFKCK